jgi:hypothetical protein
MLSLSWLPHIYLFRVSVYFVSSVQQFYSRPETLQILGDREHYVVFFVIHQRLRHPYLPLSTRSTSHRSRDPTYVDFNTHDKFNEAKIAQEVEEWLLEM